MKIILIGMKACGKTTVGKLLAKRLDINFIELDQKIKKQHFKNKKERLSLRQIFKEYGKKYFRSLEASALKRIAKGIKNRNFILDCGGGVPLKEGNQRILANLGKIIFLDADKNVILKRILKNGLPAFFPKNQDLEKSLDELLEKRVPIYKKLADLTIEIKNKTPEEITGEIIKKAKKVLSD